jgi:DNA adenine methylase
MSWFALGGQLDPRIEAFHWIALAIRALSQLAATIKGSRDRRVMTLDDTAALFEIASEAPRDAALRYPGAKWSIAPRIVANFSDHYHYVEPYFGSGAVFFSKAASGHELINDLNGVAINMFRMLRDHTEDLCWALEATPWSREEYDGSHVLTGDNLEDARRFVVRCWQAHASDLAKKTGWKNRGSRQRAGGMSIRWQKVPEQLRAVAERLQDAEIENRPALEVIRRFNTADTLIYADPPYLPSTRTQKMYGEEMTEQEHIELLEVLLNHAGHVVLSGYANDLYTTMLAGWQQIEIAPPKVEKGAPRVEVLYVKR